MTVNEMHIHKRVDMLKSTAFYHKFSYLKKSQVCFQCIFEGPLCVFDTDETSHAAVIGHAVFV